MHEIKINIDCEEIHCGNCSLTETHLTGIYCRAFHNVLEFDDKGCKRVPECINADTENEGSFGPFFFKNKYHVRYKENEACCENCQKFVIDKSGETFRFVSLVTKKAEDVRLGDCLLAKEEKRSIIKTIVCHVCDAHRLREAQDGE